MPVSESFLEYALEQLQAAPYPITHKRMFGGVGIYADERFVALIADDRLYLKVGESNRADFERENCEPFRPYGDDRAMSYFEVPVRVLEDRDELVTWIDRSYEVAGESRVKRKRRRGPATR